MVPYIYFSAYVTIQKLSVHSVKSELKLKKKVNEQYFGSNYECQLILLKTNIYGVYVYIHKSTLIIMECIDCWWTGESFPDSPGRLGELTLSQEE